MIRFALVLFLVVGCAFAQNAATQQPGQGTEPSAMSMFRLPLPERQSAPVLIPTTPEDATLIEVPYAISGWSGRGFATPDMTVASGNNPSAGVAGDFMLMPGDLRGYKRFAIAPLVASSSRTLHLFMGERTLTLEFFVAQERQQAFRSVTFVDAVQQEKDTARIAAAERERRMQVTREDTPPESRYTDPTEETQQGMQRFMRALLNMSEEMARRMVAANPMLQLAKHDRNIPSGDYSITIRFAVRDSLTDTLGICVALNNHTAKKLIFDPQSWMLRAGDMVYPIKTTDFAGSLDASSTQLVFLVLTRGIDGKPTRLLPDNKFTVAVELRDSVSAKPVQLIDLNKIGENRP